MAHREAAPRAERQLLAHAAFLPLRVGNGVGLDGGPDRGVAEGEPADLLGRDHVAVEQDRGDRQHVGDVVEPVAGLVGRQQLPLVDLQGEQVADGVAVLDAVQAVDGRTARIGVGRRGRVESGLEDVGGGGVGLGIRPRSARRGHRLPAQLAYDLLPGFDFPGHAADVLGVDGLQAQSGLTRAVVVARHAVPIEQRPRRGCGFRHRRRLPCQRRFRRLCPPLTGAASREHETEPPHQASGRHCAVNLPARPTRHRRGRNVPSVRSDPVVHRNPDAPAHQPRHRAGPRPGSPW